MTEKDYGYEYPIRATDYGEEIFVRKMRKDEMPDDGNTYYVTVNGTIYSHDAYPDDIKRFKILDNKE